jgi:predicted transcriptional regulator
MKNITLALDDEVLEKVRTYAAERKTTVNAIVRQHLEKIAAENDKRAEARRHLLRLAETSEGRMAPGYVWNREELYDRPVLRRHEHSGLRREGEE